LVAEVQRSSLQGGGEGGLEIFGPEREAIAPALIDQVGWVVPSLVAVDPVVDTHPAGSKQLGDLGDGPACSDFQNGQGAPVEVGIRGGSELFFEPASPSCGQVYVTHGIPR
jgi:hypothetical protein